MILCDEMHGYVWHCVLEVFFKKLNFFNFFLFQINFFFIFSDYFKKFKTLKAFEVSYWIYAQRYLKLAMFDAAGWKIFLKNFKFILL